MMKFVALRPNMNSYLTDDGSIDKKTKGTKKCDVRREIKFQDYSE